MIDLEVLNRANDILEGLEIEASQENLNGSQSIIISLRGILSHMNTSEFADKIMEFFQGDWKEYPLILDLEKLQYISSSGIGSFSTIRMQADHKNSPLYLIQMNSKVRQVFDQLGFSSFFEILDSLEDIP